MNSSVRVMDQPGSGLPAFDRHLQCPADFFRLQTAMHVVAHDPPGVGIRYQAQVDTFLLGGDISDIRHPNFLWPGSCHLLRPILEQIRMFAKAVMAVRRLVIRTSSWHEQTSGPQQVKQTVSAKFDTPFFEWIPQQVMQFTRTNPGLLQTLLLHQFDNNRISFKFGLFATQLLVIRLSTDSIMAAGRRDAQAFDLTFLEDLPKGFFGILIPYSFLITSSMASNKRAFSWASLS